MKKCARCSRTSNWPMPFCPFCGCQMLIEVKNIKADSAESPKVYGVGKTAEFDSANDRAMPAAASTVLLRSEPEKTEKQPLPQPPVLAGGAAKPDGLNFSFNGEPKELSDFSVTGHSAAAENAPSGTAVSPVSPVSAGGAAKPDGLSFSFSGEPKELSDFSVTGHSAAAENAPSGTAVSPVLPVSAGGAAKPDGLSFSFGGEPKELSDFSVTGHSAASEDIPAIGVSPASSVSADDKNGENKEAITIKKIHTPITSEFLKKHPSAGIDSSRN